MDEVVEVDGGRVQVMLRYGDPDWLVRLVLGLGGGARLVEPRDLVEAVGRRARDALAAAGAGGTG
jgi:proteasome accessory factor C